MTLFSATGSKDRMHTETHKTWEWFTLLIKILRTFLLGDQMLSLLQRIVKGKKKIRKKKPAHYSNRDAGASAWHYLVSQSISVHESSVQGVKERDAQRMEGNRGIMNSCGSHSQVTQALLWHGSPTHSTDLWQYSGITDWLTWKGSQKAIINKPSAQAQTPEEGCPPPCPAAFQRSPRKTTPQPVRAACGTAQSPWQ